MATIIVTGGAGFIGSHCIDILLARGDTVICVDNFNDFYNPAIKRTNIAKHLDHPNFTLKEIDIGEPAIIDLIVKTNPDKILHLAARAGVQPSLNDPREYVRTNIVGTTNILEGARQAGVKHIVAASSSSVYGGNTNVPFNENDRVDNQYSPYAATKKSCEVIASTYHHLFNMHISMLRYFTVYGPRNRPDMAAYKFTNKILNGEDITLYGKPGEIKRDWTFVSDIAAGTIAALDNIERFGFEIINLGNSKPVALSDFVETLEKELGTKATIKRASLPPGDVPITYADSTKAKQLLDWESQTTLPEGIAALAAWFKEHKGL